MGRWATGGVSWGAGAPDARGKGMSEMGVEGTGGTHGVLEGSIGEGLLGAEVGGLDGAHLVPDVAVAFLVELDNVHDSLGVLFLL